MSVLNQFLDNVVREIVNPIILLLSAAAFVVLLWGIYEFVANAANGENLEEGRRAIMWGLIGLVVIFGAYGIINIALGTFNLPSIHR